MKELKEQMYIDFMRAFFDEWWKHTIDNNGDNKTYIDIEFSLEPYMEYVNTMNPSSLRIFFVKEAKAKCVAIKSIKIENNIVYANATFDDTIIKEEVEKNSYKYMDTKEQLKYNEKQEKKKSKWRNVKIDL